ncbi:MAG: hypothetical protein ACYSUP_04965 [Planctomycetota bacterium]
MRKVIITSLILLMVMGIGVLFAGKGNQAPSGKHYNLNIIGVPNEKNANFDGGNGSRIFVLRTGSTQFYVHGGDSYQVLDHDGTDGRVGEDRLNPGIIFPYESDAWQVEIYVRLVGPKTSSVRWTSKYFDGAEWVLIDQFTLRKSSKFSLKTGSLLKDGFRDVLWILDQKTKFRNCQMRIYLK